MIASAPSADQRPRAADVALMFLKQYIEVFDADKRDQLIDAYHEQCRFSLVVCLPSRGTVEK